MSLVVLTETQKADLIKRAFLYARPKEIEKSEKLDFHTPIEQLGLQSITALEMAGFIEEELDIDFDDRDLINVNRIQDLIDLIEKH